MSESQPLLTIIIPAYNEEYRLPRSLEQIVAFIQAQPEPMEVLVVENGSRDHTTEIAEGFAAEYPFVRVIHSEKGKGAAVKAGMMVGSGRYLFICDSDLSMPIAEVRKFLPPVQAEYDVAIGSREGPGADRFGEPPYRHLMGRVFNLIVRVWPSRASRIRNAASRVFATRWARKSSPSRRCPVGPSTWKRCSSPCGGATK